MQSDRDLPVPAFQAKYLSNLAAQKLCTRAQYVFTSKANPLCIHLNAAQSKSQDTDEQSLGKQEHFQGNHQIDVVQASLFIFRVYSKPSSCPQATEVTDKAAGLY